MSKRCIIILRRLPQKITWESLVSVFAEEDTGSAEAVLGPYDIMAVIEGLDLRSLSNIITDNLYDLGVKSPIT